MIVYGAYTAVRYLAVVLISTMLTMLSESITTCTDAYINLQASKIYRLISLLLENRMTVCMVKPTYVNYVKYTA